MTALAAGIDVAPGAWVMAIIGPDRDHPSELLAAEHVAELIDVCRTRGVAAVGIDIPIGFATNGDRASDRLARKRVGGRHSSVFTTPAYAVLSSPEGDYLAASALNEQEAGRRITKQSFNLLSRSREVRAAISPGDQPWVSEVHPECSFAALNGSPSLQSKHQAGGRRERISLVEANVAADAARVSMYGPAPVVDALDAYAAAWSAARRSTGDAELLGGGLDPEGYELVIAV